jgi:hypothetical protein
MGFREVVKREKIGDVDISPKGLRKLAKALKDAYGTDGDIRLPAEVLTYGNGRRTISLTIARHEEMG